MAKIKSQTGYGYFKDASERIHSKVVCLPGTEFELTLGFVFFEVADQTELDAIEIYQNPAQIQVAQQEQKIAEKLRSLAINELIKDGNWP